MPSSLDIGWPPVARSMIDSRRWPSATPGIDSYGGRILVLGEVRAVVVRPAVPQRDRSCAAESAHRSPVGISPDSAGDAAHGERGQDGVGQGPLERSPSGAGRQRPSLGEIRQSNISVLGTKYGRPAKRPQFWARDRPDLRLSSKLGRILLMNFLSRGGCAMSLIRLLLVAVLALLTIPSRADRRGLPTKPRPSGCPRGDDRPDRRVDGGADQGGGARSRRRGPATRSSSAASIST